MHIYTKQFHIKNAFIECLLYRSAALSLSALACTHCICWLVALIKLNFQTLCQDNNTQAELYITPPLAFVLQTN